MTIRRRREELGLFGSTKTTRKLTEVQKRQLVLDQMAKDPSGRKGPARMREKIVEETGHLLTRCVLGFYFVF